jgi:IS66 C-terminal element
MSSILQDSKIVNIAAARSPPASEPRKTKFLRLWKYFHKRKNSLFAGHDEGAFNWACVASLIETAKLNGLNPQAYLADVLTKLVNGWPMKKLDALLPWVWSAQGSGDKQAA